MSSRPFILDTDALLVGIGAVISQADDHGREHVIAYASQSLSKSQRRYGVPRREMYAVVHFTQHFRHYLLGAQFVLRTDYRSLLWLDSFQDAEGILARWLEKLASFNYINQHRPGKSHGNADALSRLPEATKLTDEAVEQVRVSSLPSLVDRNVQGTSEATINVISTSELGATAMWAKFWSPDDLRAAQDEDVVLSRMVGWQQALLDRPIRSDPAMKGATPTLLRLWNQWNRLKLIDGILYRTFVGDGVTTDSLQLVLPQSLKPVVLKSLHADCAGGHLGTEKTLEKVRQRFYWPVMLSDVEAFCRSCADCEARNTSALCPPQYLSLVHLCRQYGRHTRWSEMQWISWVLFLLLPVETDT